MELNSSHVFLASPSRQLLLRPGEKPDMFLARTEGIFEPVRKEERKGEVKLFQGRERVEGPFLLPLFPFRGRHVMP